MALEIAVESSDWQKVGGRSDHQTDLNAHPGSLSPLTLGAAVALTIKHPGLVRTKRVEVESTGVQRYSAAPGASPGISVSASSGCLGHWWPRGPRWRFWWAPTLRQWALACARWISAALPAFSSPGSPRSASALPAACCHPVPLGEGESETKHTDMPRAHGRLHAPEPQGRGPAMHTWLSGAYSVGPTGAFSSHCPTWSWVPNSKCLVSFSKQSPGGRWTLCTPIP